MARDRMDEVPMLLDSHSQRSQDSLQPQVELPSFPIGRSASTSSPMTGSFRRHDKDRKVIPFSGPLRSEGTGQVFIPMSAPLQSHRGLEGTGIPMSGPSRSGRKMEERVTDTQGIVTVSGGGHASNDHYGGRHEHLLKSGPLGRCNDPFCTTCPSYYDYKEINVMRSQLRPIFAYKSAFLGDAKGSIKNVGSLIRAYIPGIMNPHAKIVQQWNKFFVISCLIAIFVDPLFFFVLSVREDDRCIVLNRTLATVITVLRSITDFVYFLHMLLQFRLAYVAPESRVVGAGDLVDDPKEITHHYLSGYFMVDLFVVLPLPQIMIWVVLPKYVGRSSANYAKNLLRATILLQYIPRMVRFLPLLAGSSATGFIFESAWADFVINLLIFILAVAASSSSFCLLARITPGYRSFLCKNLSAAKHAMASSLPQQPPLRQAVPPAQSQDLEAVIKYHQQTKHSFRKYANGPHGLDWANQPNPFRRYETAPVISLDHFDPDKTADPLYPHLFLQFPDPKPFDKATISQLFYDSLALSAWKTTGYSTWSLRVNPSSGNLHPTEGYLIAGPVPGISETAFIAHYAPKEHRLEIRAEIPPELWGELSKRIPEDSILVGFSSIFWREAWKYGERAFRYCNHDVGHAIGAVSIAAAVLGWDTRLIDGLGNRELELLLGLSRQKHIRIPNKPIKGYFPELEQEHADCVLAVFPAKNQGASQLESPLDYRLLSSAISRLGSVELKGRANALSKEHICWDIIYRTAEIVKKPLTENEPNICSVPLTGTQIFSEASYQPLSIRKVVRKRRSAVDMDGRYSIDKNTFYQILLKALPSHSHGENQGQQQQLPFRTLPWRAELHMVLFVHRVVGIPAGIYFLVRNSDHFNLLRRAMRPEFEWAKPEGCPPGLPLYRLGTIDCRELAIRLSCHQDIAGDSCFSLGMLARFEPALHDQNVWMYPRLFWEAGLLGQILYLEAHAVGISATGIGCYFDDPVHDILGLSGREFQSLYHFTIGIPVLDRRIMSLPAYPGPAVDL